MYTKNLEHLLRLLQASRQSGRLIVGPPEQESASWQGQFRLVEGTIYTCNIYRNADGQVLLHNDEAVRWLIAQGKLRWSLEEGGQVSEELLPAPLPLQGNAREKGKSDAEIRTVSAPATTEHAEWIPQRTPKGTQTSAQSLGSLEHLQVFTLINGQNTVEGITRILRKPSSSTLRILHDLRSAGLIK